MISRKTLISMRKSLSEKEYIERNELIYTNFLNAIDFSGKSVMSYCSFNNEVDTEKINQDIIKKNGNIILPKSNWDTLGLIPYKISCQKEVILSKYGIPEPLEKKENLISKEEIDIVIVPGVIFDKNLFRIGYGKGFYDRFLSGLRPDVLKVGLAYDFQIINDSHPKEHDIAMDVLICENGFVDL
jgi:5-formyltetrahydrofolate cyclo-ligase